MNTGVTHLGLAQIRPLLVPSACLLVAGRVYLLFWSPLEPDLTYSHTQPVEFSLLCLYLITMWVMRLQFCLARKYFFAIKNPGM